MEYQRRIVGETIRMLRQENGQTQEVLSGLSGIARSHLSMIETGVKSANFETLWKIAYALKMKPSELVAHIEQAMDTTQ